MKYKISSGFDVEDGAGKKRSCSVYLVLNDDGVGENMILNMLDSAVYGFEKFLEEAEIQRSKEDWTEDIDNMDNMEDWPGTEKTDSMFGDKIHGDKKGWFQ